MPVVLSNTRVLCGEYKWGDLWRKKLVNSVAVSAAMVRLCMLFQLTKVSLRHFSDFLSGHQQTTVQPQDLRKSFVLRGPPAAALLSLDSRRSDSAEALSHPFLYLWLSLSA